MPKYRAALPQINGQLFLTDGGLETTLVFHQGIDLPQFAAFDLLRTRDGRQILKDYFLPYIEAAGRHGYGFILDSVTWRANPDWAAKLGYSKAALAAANQDAIDLMLELRAEHERPGMPMVVSGLLGPRGDGYFPEEVMSPEDAEAYHGEQIGVFARTEADMISALTMTNVNEAIGITRAAGRHGMPVAISFTVETDGRLPTGQTLREAIEAVDAATGPAPAYYMINCAHPTHFESTISAGGDWLQRLRGLRANASKRSHAELNEASELDVGNPEELGGQYRDLRALIPNLQVLGGCCGTDHRHVACIGAACRLAA
jgi:homocysteine S-methyltransferase